MKIFSHLKISRARMLASATVLFVVAGCTMVPKYKQPDVPLAKTWPSVPGYAQTKTVQTNVQVADIGWRDFFLDQRLQQVIELSLTNNPNLYVAVQNVVETKALYRVQQAQLIPTIDLNANGQRTRTPNVYTGGTNVAPPLQYTEYNVNLGVASYELDLFGR